MNGSRKAIDIFSSKEEFERVLSQAEGSAETDFELEFCESMREKYDKYGMNMFLSDRQEEVLDEIAYK